jgi:hypothetical protein
VRYPYDHVKKYITNVMKLRIRVPPVSISEKRSYILMLTKFVWQEYRRSIKSAAKPWQASSSQILNSSSRAVIYK